MTAALPVPLPYVMDDSMMGEALAMWLRTGSCTQPTEEDRMAISREKLIDQITNQLADRKVLESKNLTERDVAEVVASTVQASLDRADEERDQLLKRVNDAVSTLSVTIARNPDIPPGIIACRRKLALALYGEPPKPTPEAAEALFEASRRVSS